ncbi:MAG: hypothetical protein VXW11_08550 [Pseudomonadota bacterium]|nr:hypothetical protein [Pseudomonadota bacterium]
MMLASLGAKAAEFIRPSEALSAQDVVEIQLLGLQAGDGDRQAGIEQVWIFAHPDNKRVTGPLAKFSTLFDIPHFWRKTDLICQSCISFQAGARASRMTSSNQPEARSRPA